MSEAGLSTDGERLLSAGCLIAEKRGGKLHVVENDVGGSDPKHRTLLVEFVEWREQRAKVLRTLLRVKEMSAVALAKGALAFSARVRSARPRGEI